MMQLFYSPVIDSNYFTLNEEESRHCVKVLRLKYGAEVFLTNGQGACYRAVIEDANPRACVLRILEKSDIQNPHECRLHIAIAPPKNADRLEWFLEKATECGIDEITPIICDNSERTMVKPARLEKVMASAMKQSLRYWLPKLNQAIDLKHFFEVEQTCDKYMAHCSAGNKNQFQTVYNKGKNALMLIGPEGDFSSQEVEWAQSRGYQEISLGAFRLRTETAALAICVAFNLLNKRM